MKIHGFQKMTLLDFPGKVACTVFTAGCNLRCPFCHNAFLVTQLDANAEISQGEIMEYITRRKGILDGVCITGGEPLLDDGVFDFMKEIKQTGLLVKLDTNGTFPEKLKRAVREGLADYVAMDIKNTPEKYGETVGIASFDTTPVLESIDFLLSGTVGYEFRTTVVREYHTLENIAEIAKRIRKAPRYFLQNFVDSGNLIGEHLHGVSAEDMLLFQKAAQQYIVDTKVRG